MRPTLASALLAVGLLALTGPAQAVTVHMKYIPTGAAERLGGYQPVPLKLSTTAPDIIKKAPADLTAPLYGVIKIGPKENPASIAVIVDQPAGKDSQLFVDSNGDGDLTNDPAPEWKHVVQNGKPIPVTLGGASVHVPDGTTTRDAHLGMYCFDKAARPDMASILLYYSDYGCTGDLKLGDKTYHAMLSDDRATGDFRGADQGPSGVVLHIDRDGDGQYDPHAESFDIKQPFNIDGVTYEVTHMAAGGGSFNIERSKQSVPEIPIAGVGQPCIPFDATTVDNKSVHFPADFKGKIVMLDFWATWCGPCRGEIPNVVDAYGKYHKKGFEILGVSLDQANAQTKLEDFTKANKMPWLQVYDGKFWQAAVAQLYQVSSIPAAFLIDGNTGKILAKGGAIRGPGLAPAIEKALAELKKAATRP